MGEGRHWISLMRAARRIESEVTTTKSRTTGIDKHCIDYIFALSQRNENPTVERYLDTHDESTLLRRKVCQYDEEGNFLKGDWDTEERFVNPSEQSFSDHFHLVLDTRVRFPPIVPFHPELELVEEQESLLEIREP